MKVIVTNARNRIAYAIARSLAKQNAEVITSDSITTAMSFVSRYSTGHFIYPSPYRDEEAFIRCLVEMCKKYKPDVLLPVYEETFVVAKYKKVLADYVNLFVPDYDRILAVHDKQTLYNTAESLGIPVPRTASLTSLEQDPRNIDFFRFPVLVKPRQGGGAWGIERVDSATGLLSMLSSRCYPGGFPADRFVVQELISGQVSCCSILARRGAYRAGYCYRQLRETPLSGGTATYRESIVSPHLMKQFGTLLEYLQWDGIAQADFIVDNATGNPYLIDVNPRFWGSLHQAIVSGVDFPSMVCQLAVLKDFTPVLEYDTRYRTRWIWGDLKCFVEFIKDPDIRPDIALRDFLRISAFDRYDDFELRDPLPFFMWFADYSYKMVQQKKLHPVPHEEKVGVWE